MQDQEVDPLETCRAWLDRLQSAAQAADVTLFADLFLSYGWLRDLLCFSWDFRTLSTREKISVFLSEQSGEKTRLATASLRNIQLDTTFGLGFPEFFPVPGSPKDNGIQGSFAFTITHPQGQGRGFFRIIRDPTGIWRAFTVLTSLENLGGYEEPQTRPLGVYDHHMRSWGEVHAEQIAAIEKDPTVLIVGGGQSGLMCAARLGRMGIRALVVEKTARVGDVWRQRYPTLTLHTSAQHCTVLYHPWPKTYPEYLPKDVVADFLEAYAIGQNLVVWLSSTVLPTPVHDNVTGKWLVVVERAGQQVRVHPKHIVMATGNGKPRIPDFIGMNKFKGPMFHSDKYQGAGLFKGKKAVVIGAGNAAADACMDFVAKGVSEVTMVQRSATCVISAKAMKQTFLDPQYPETKSIEDLDFVYNSVPHALTLQMAISGRTEQVKAIDRELHEGLKRAGFKLTWELAPGSGDVGLFGFLFDRFASGSMVDVGCGKLIIEGKVKVKQGVEVDHFEEDSVFFQDGSKLPADVVVFATGNEPIIQNVFDVFGESISEKIGSKIWGLDDEGELRGCFRSTGQPGLWVAPGAFQHVRFFSKHLALQILGQELGLAPA